LIFAAFYRLSITSNDRIEIKSNQNRLFSRLFAAIGMEEIKKGISDIQDDAIKSHKSSVDETRTNINEQRNLKDISYSWSCCSLCTVDQLPSWHFKVSS